MRILIVSQYFWPEPFRVTDLAKALHSLGHEVTVLTGRPNYPEGAFYPDFLEDPGRFSSLEGIEILRLPHTPRGKGTRRLIWNYLTFAVAGAVLTPFVLRGRKFDVVFMNQLSPVFSAVPAIVAKWTKQVPLAMWILDLWPESLQALGFGSKWIVEPVRFFTHFVFRRCSLLLAQSAMMADRIAKAGPRGVLPKVFPSWAEETAEDAVPVPPSYPRRVDGVFDVVFAGNIGEAQDFPTVLAAAERLKTRANIRFLIVGDGRAAGWVREEITARGLSERVLMQGRLPGTMMPDVFGRADALLIALRPSLAFDLTVPGKVQSYMLAGKPIVSAVSGAAAQAIGESGGGVVSPAGDAVGLAESIIKLADMAPEQRAQLGAAAQRYAKAHYDRTMLVAQLQDWFEMLVAGKPIDS